jgi:thiol-disulfide isomerase/thioredoxin
MFLTQARNRIKKIIPFVLLIFLVSIFSFTAPVLAGINDDRYDGNVFILYAGNGSLVPSKLTLPETFARKMPALLVFYTDDSRDCKQFSIVVSRLQEFYGRAASIIPVTVDSIPIKDHYNPDEPGYYYQGLVPQTVLLNQEGKIVLNETGQVSFEKIDDVFRQVFDLLPRTESAELKFRSYNEFNAELSE